MLCASVVDATFFCVSVEDTTFLCVSVVEATFLCVSVVDATFLCASVVDAAFLCASVVDATFLCASEVDATFSRCCVDWYHRFRGTRPLLLPRWNTVYYLQWTGLKQACVGMLPGRNWHEDARQYFYLYCFHFFIKLCLLHSLTNS